MSEEHFEHKPRKHESQKEINKPFDPEKECAKEDKGGVSTNAVPARTGEPDPGH